MYEDVPRESERIYEMYVVKNMTQKEIADELGVSKATVSRRMDKYDIEAGYNGSLHPHFDFDDGYPIVSARTSNGRKQFYLHRLTAFAHFDGSLDEFAGKQVHHRNKHKCDSRPDNLEVLSKRQHQSVHHMRELVEDNGWPVLLSPRYVR